jgi:hypothetical protein
MGPLFQRIIALLLISASCVAYVDCQTPVSQYPSNQIKHIAPPKEISLQNVDPWSAYQLNVQNGPLPAFLPKVMPDLGHWRTEPTPIYQDAGDPSVVSFANFTKGATPLPNIISAPPLLKNISDGSGESLPTTLGIKKNTSKVTINVSEVGKRIYL